MKVDFFMGLNVINKKLCNFNARIQKYSLVSRNIMTNSFPENFPLYPPEDEPVLNYFRDYFDSVFIALIPFSKFCDKKIEDFRKLKTLNQEIKYIKDRISDRYRFEKYPYFEESLTDVEEYFYCEKLYWKDILEITQIENYRSLHRALLTSIGALKKEWEEKELKERLVRYASSYKFWLPGEGSYDVFSKAEMFKLFNEYKLSKINVVEEFNQTNKNIDLHNLSELQFIKTIEHKDYYIFSEHKEILFTIDWDYFFFFICIDSQKISKDSIENKFDGFWANSEDSHLWYWKK